MIRVNLVPQEILDKELQKQRLAQVSVAAGLVGMIFLAVSAGHYYKSVALETRLTEAEAEFKKLEAIVKQVEALEAQAKAVKSRLDVIGSLLQARSFNPVFMTRLQEALGDGVWLISLSATGGPEMAVDMGCRAASSLAATRWLRQLQDNAYFKSPVMGGLAISADGTVGFTMSAKYKPSEGGKK